MTNHSENGLRHRIRNAVPRLRRLAFALLDGDRGRSDKLVERSLSRLLDRRAAIGDQRDMSLQLIGALVSEYRESFRAGGPAGGAAPAQARSGSVSGEGDDCFGSMLRTIALLDPDSRCALMLISLEGLTYAEAAEILQRSVDDLRSQLHAARKRIVAATMDHERPRSAPKSGGRIKRLRRRAAGADSARMASSTGGTPGQSVVVEEQ